MANTKITTNVIADDAITTAKIADDAVGNDQLASGLTLGGNTAATLSTAAQPNITSLGTLSALTISGDLTVDTSTLKVDSSNNRVGIGTTSPSEELHVNSSDSGNHTRVHITKTTTAGTAGVSLRSKDASNTWTIYSEDASASKLYFYDGAASVMTLDSANNRVGIGTDSPASLLHLSTTAPILSFTDTNSFSDANDRFIIRASGGNMGNIQWYDDSASSTATLMTFLSGGNVGIGTTSPDTLLDIEYTASNHTQGIHITNSQPGGYGNAITFISERSDNNSLEVAARIGTQGASSWNSDATTDSNLLFSTVNNNTLAERMRINNNGQFLVGRTTDDVDTIGAMMDSNGIVYSSINETTFNTFLYRAAQSANAYRFYVNGSGQVSSTFTSISSLSDARLKENVRDYTAGLNDILKLQPRVFDWKENEGKNIKNDVGFIAQEFEEVFPDWISNFLHDDLEDAKTVAASELIFPMVNAIKELKAEIDALKEKLDG